MALLSRFPIEADAVEDYSRFLWRDLPGGHAAGVLSADAVDALRLQTMGLWEVPVDMPDGSHLNLLTIHAGAPVFDGPEDRNGLRNEDETRHLLQVVAAQEGHFAVMGTLNVDPEPGRGEGRRAALQELLATPSLLDPEPLAPDGTVATTNWPEPRPGRLRVDYLLPSIGLEVVGAGVFGTAEDEQAVLASGHRLVWVDIVIPQHEQADE